MDLSTGVGRQRTTPTFAGDIETYDIHSRRVMSDDEFIVTTALVNPDIGTVILIRNVELIVDCQCVEEIVVTRITSSLTLTLTSYNFVQ